MKICSFSMKKQLNSNTNRYVGHIKCILSTMNSLDDCLLACNLFNNISGGHFTVRNISI